MTHIPGVLDGVLPDDDDDDEPEQSNTLSETEAFELTKELREKYPPGHQLNQEPPKPLGEDSSIEDYAAQFNRRT